MENKIQEQSVSEQKSIFFCVTPFSKYLAMALFILLPFIGGWIGYSFAPEKIVETERIVVRNDNNSAHTSTVPAANVASNLGQNVYTDTSGEFAFSYSSGYRAEWDDVANKYIQNHEDERTNIFDKSKSLIFTVLAREASGSCYLGLCNDVGGKVAVSSDVEWANLNLKNCVGGCDAVNALYKTTHNGKTFYLVAWKNSTSSSDILETFKWLQ